jgi:hypothetical protein
MSLTELEGNFRKEFDDMHWVNVDNVLNDLKEQCKSQVKIYMKTIERLIEHMQWFRKNKTQLIDTNEKLKKRNQNQELTNMITSVVSTKQPNLRTVSEILVIKKYVDELKAALKKTTLQQQLSSLNEIISEMTLTNDIPIKQLIPLFQCLKGLCEDKMWSSSNTDARSMIINKINECLSSIENFNESISCKERLLLTKRILLLYNLIFSLAENSNIGVKRDLVSTIDDTLTTIKKRKNINWFTL